MSESDVERILNDPKVQGAAPNWGEHNPHAGLNPDLDVVPTSQGSALVGTEAARRVVQGITELADTDARRTPEEIAAEAEQRRKILGLSPSGKDAQTDTPAQAEPEALSNPIDDIINRRS